jgi:hypothetical protein
VADEYFRLDRKVGAVESRQVDHPLRRPGADLQDMHKVVTHVLRNIVAA